jgi:hypothetical protein
MLPIEIIEARNINGRRTGAEWIKPAIPAKPAALPAVAKANVFITIDTEQAPSMMAAEHAPMLSLNA